MSDRASLKILLRSTLRSKTHLLALVKHIKPSEVKVKVRHEIQQYRKSLDMQPMLKHVRLFTK